MTVSRAEERSQVRLDRRRRRRKIVKTSIMTVSAAAFIAWLWEWTGG